MRLKLAAQARDVHLNRVRCDFFVPAGQGLQQLVFAGGLGRVNQQVLHYRPFTRAELYQLAIGTRLTVG